MIQLIPISRLVWKKIVLTRLCQWARKVHFIDKEREIQTREGHAQGHQTLVWQN